MRIVEAAALSDKGPTAAFNEDAVLMLEKPVIVAVADGAGGPGVGNVASSIATMTLRRSAKALETEARRVRRDPSSQGRLKLGRALEDVFNYTHDQVKKAASRSSQPHMSTTMVAGLVSAGRLHIAHVGEARAYLFRNGRLRLLTEDHTLAMARLRQGRMTKEEYTSSPLRRQLYQAIGVGPDIDVDVAEIDLAADDILMFCSDGIHRCLSNDHMARCLQGRTMVEAAQSLIDHANAANTDDNASVVLLRVSAEATVHSTLLDEIAKVLAEVFLFRGLSGAERSLIAPFLEHKMLQPGEVLFREGDNGDAFYVVVDGSVRITRGDTVLTEVGAGGNFGELCLAREAPRSATVTAVENTMVFELTRERFLEIIRRKPSIGSRISLAAVENVSSRLRDLTERLAVVEALSTGERDTEGMRMPDAIRLAVRGKLS